MGIDTFNIDGVGCAYNSRTCSTVKIAFFKKAQSTFNLYIFLWFI